MRQACFAAGRAFLSKINKWPDAAVKTLLQGGSNFHNAVYTRKQYQHFPTIRNGTLVQPDDLISAKFSITRSTVAFLQLSCLLHPTDTSMWYSTPQDYSLIRMIRIFKSHLSPISFSAIVPTRKNAAYKVCKDSMFLRHHLLQRQLASTMKSLYGRIIEVTSPSTGGRLVGDMLLWRTGLRSGRPHHVAILAVIVAQSFVAYLHTPWCLFTDAASR